MSYEIQQIALVKSSIQEISSLPSLVRAITLIKRELEEELQKKMLERGTVRSYSAMKEGWIKKPEKIQTAQIH